MPESSPNTGELLDARYLLESRIGVGGMGVVYRAVDETLGRTVALKMFRESAGEPASEQARLASETRLLASLNHASLVTLYDARVGRGAPDYLVMEFVDGPTLRERLSQGPLADGDVAAMARDLAEALHVVHQAGIVHRDIKPSNVLLRRSHVPGEEYRAKLADFGIAYLVDSTRLTTPGTLVGTAAYLSPEQVRGAEPAPASDIYALGLVLIEALTGARAFPQTGTHEAALARLTLDPAIPGSVGYEWKSLLTAMTAREPEQRPTALDVVLAAARLDAPGQDPATEVTGTLLTAPTQALAGSGAQDGTGTAPTQALSAQDTPEALPTAPTRILPEAAAPIADPETDSGPIVTGPLRIRRRLAIIAVVAVIVIAVIVGVLIWALSASSPAAQPTLPTLDEPLGTHFQQLLDAVTP